LAAIFAAANPEQVDRLILIEAPLRFGTSAGAFAPLRRRGAARFRASRHSGQPDLPGSFLNLGSTSAAPVSFQWRRWEDLWWEALAGRTFLQFISSSSDGRSTSSRCPAGCRFARVDLRLGERRVGLGDLRDIPILAVVGPQSQVTPPASTLAPIPSSPGNSRRVLEYPGEAGVALRHVGAVVGRGSMPQSAGAPSRPD
jgi:polyhydroxyalkanoate synthase